MQAELTNEQSQIEKTEKAAQIDRGALTRLRLDELFEQRAHGDLDDDQLLAAVRAPELLLVGTAGIEGARFS